MIKKQVYVHPCLKVREVQARKMLAASFVAPQNTGTEQYEEVGTETTNSWF